ncbi:hypothetical protein FOZ76_15180 [Verticiella sediminum]|uniref:Uncharacterized protein n=1 Tax=Verticiella sediminum TaxID=1247510 RepID=A0A556AIQ2_9BURK|nr:hypothetical protein [Verticiella sediminum]TSH92750.1 hypothetical protein FOZ76_15180 [Verticiella sediminum]
MVHQSDPDIRASRIVRSNGHGFLGRKGRGKAAATGSNPMSHDRAQTILIWQSARSSSIKGRHLSEGNAKGRRAFAIAKEGFAQSRLPAEAGRYKFMPGNGK